MKKQPRRLKLVLPNGMRVAINVNKTHCKHGHEYTDNNIIWKMGMKGDYIRTCRTCRKHYKSKRDRERYRNDEAFRLKKIARANLQRQLKKGDGYESRANSAD